MDVGRKVMKKRSQQLGSNQFRPSLDSQWDFRHSPGNLMVSHCYPYMTHFPSDVQAFTNIFFFKCNLLVFLVQSVTTTSSYLIEKVYFFLNQNWPFSRWCDTFPTTSQDKKKKFFLRDRVDRETLSQKKTTITINQRHRISHSVAQARAKWRDHNSL